MPWILPFEPDKEQADRGPLHGPSRWHLYGRISHWIWRIRNVPGHLLRHVYIWHTQTSKQCQCNYARTCNYKDTTSLWILSHHCFWTRTNRFYGVCNEALDLLKINCHVLLGDNHNPMLVERLCRYFNKGHAIMWSEWDTVHVALECLLLLLYAWNSCPVHGTNISHSYVVVGWEFAFLIDFFSGKHWQLTSSPATMESYSKDLATRLSVCCKITDIWSRRHVIGTKHLSVTPSWPLCLFIWWHCCCSSCHPFRCKQGPCW